MSHSTVSQPYNHMRNTYKYYVYGKYHIRNISKILLCSNNNKIVTRNKRARTHKYIKPCYSDIMDSRSNTTCNFCNTILPTISMKPEYRLSLYPRQIVGAHTGMPSRKGSFPTTPSCSW